MKHTPARHSLTQGFTLVETLVGSAVLFIFFAAIAIILQLALRSLAESKVRTVAATLASSRLELAKNLPFAQVGTIGGIPSGSLEASEALTLNNQNFSITTSVVYIDDPFDGVAPTDSLPIDYKRVKVAVTWDGPFAPTTPVIASTDVAPRGLEDASGTGTLSLSVVDAQGAALANATVTIEAPSLIPPIDLDTLTDAQGKVMLPGAPQCIECYMITVTKTGYSTDRTYSTSEVTNPAKPPASILEAQVTHLSFAIDQLSTLTLRAVRNQAANYAPFQGVQMKVIGSKEIGRTATDDPVYKYENNHATGFGGVVTVPNLEWDAYRIELPSGSSVDMAASWPYSPLLIAPATTSSFTMVVQAATPNTLLVRATLGDGSPIASASVQLTDINTNTLASASTGIAPNPDISQAFFPNLSSAQYILKILSQGYEEASASVTIVGDKIETFILNPVLP
jgi:hypothetical protein